MYKHIYFQRLKTCQIDRLQENSPKFPAGGGPLRVYVQIIHTHTCITIYMYTQISRGSERDSTSERKRRNAESFLKERQCWYENDWSTRACECRYKISKWVAFSHLVWNGGLATPKFWHRKYAHDFGKTLPVFGWKERNRQETLGTTAWKKKFSFQSARTSPPNTDSFPQPCLQTHFVGQAGTSGTGTNSLVGMELVPGQGKASSVCTWLVPWDKERSLLTFPSPSWNKLCLSHWDKHSLS